MCGSGNYDLEMEATVDVSSFYIDSLKVIDAPWKLR